MVAVGVGVEFAGGELMEAKSISNLAFRLPPTVQAVKDNDAVDPATLACCRRYSSAASSFWAQILNLEMVVKLRWRSTSVHLKSQHQSIQFL